jgi:hypothetical protein
MRADPQRQHAHMNPNSRACIASAVARLSGQGDCPAVYDYTQRKHIQVTGTVSELSVSLYDHGRRVHVTGSSSRLYDHGTGSHILLNLNGTQFTGYDHASRSHYSGTVKGNAVSIHDHETGQEHNYGV